MKNKKLKFEPLNKAQKTRVKGGSNTDAIIIVDEDFSRTDIIIVDMDIL